MGIFQFYKVHSRQSSVGSLVICSGLELPTVRGSFFKDRFYFTDNLINIIAHLKCASHFLVT